MRVKALWIAFLGVYFLWGCVPLFIGVGALGGYAISKDTLEAKVEIPFSKLCRISLRTLEDMGVKIEEKDLSAGRIKGILGPSSIRIYIDSLTEHAQRIRVSSRRALLPNLKLANEVMVKILEKVR